MTPNIREATQGDLPAVLSLYAQPDMDKGQTLSVEQAQQLLQTFARYPNYHLFVACSPEQPELVVGSYALLVMHNLGHRGTPSAIVEDVVVASTHQRQGVGKTMMRHAQSLAQAASCYKLVLSSNLERTHAHAFYRSLGFEQHGLSFRMEL